MKKSILFLLCISAATGYGKSSLNKIYKPLLQLSSPYDVQALASQNGVERYSFNVDGVHKACSLFSSRSYRTEVLSCEKNKLHVSVQYSSKTDQLCDPITDDGVSVEVSVPKGCDFSTDYGNIVTTTDVYVGADDVSYEGKLKQVITDVSISCNVKSKEFEKLHFFLTEANMDGQYYFGNDIDLRIGNKVATDGLGRVYMSFGSGDSIQIGELSISPEDICHSHTGRRKEKLVRDVEINLYDNFSFETEQVNNDYECENVGTTLEGRDWIQVEGKLSLKDSIKGSYSEVGKTRIAYRGNTCKNSDSVKRGLKNIGRNILLPFAYFF